MDTCILILLTTMRMATGVSNPCDLPTYCSVTDNKKVCVKREPEGCTNPTPSQKLYTCTKADGSKYQWDGGPTGPTKIIKGD